MEGKSHSSQPTDDFVTLLTLARDLRRRKARERQRLFAAEGVRTVEELLRSSIVVRGAIVSPALGATERGSALLAALAARDVEIAHVPHAELETAAGTDTPQGVLAIAHVPYRSLDGLVLSARARLLVLDAVQDPGNVGTLLRTAAALGADATLALPGTVDLWNPKVVRSAMGALFHRPALGTTWETLDVFLAARGIPLWVADAAGASLDDARPPESLALVVGNEGQGISQRAVGRAAARVRIPIAADVESLNVAVAAGILLHHLKPR